MYLRTCSQCETDESISKSVQLTMLRVDRVVAGVVSDEHDTLYYVEGGQNASIFAYGVTASGKTWTMQGSDRDPGLIPRTVEVNARQTTERGNLTGTM